jgi:hypothetical protein
MIKLLSIKKKKKGIGNMKMDMKIRLNCYKTYNG